MREKTSSKKNAIVKASEKLFLKNGIINTTITDIAKEAKVNHALVFYYFASIDEIYFEVVQLMLYDLKQLVLKAIEANQNNPIDLLKSYIDAYFSWVKNYPGRTKLWMYFYYLASSNKMFTKLNSEIRSTGRDRIKAILYHGMALEVFKSHKNINIEEMSLYIQGLLTGNVIMAITEESLDIENLAELTFKTISERLLL